MPITIKHNLTSKQRRAFRSHKNVIATPARPKLLITRSNKFIYLQVIDHQGNVILEKSDFSLLKNKKIATGLTKTARAIETSKALVEELKVKKITALAIDRGAYKFHGRIKAVVENIRENGVEA